MDTLRLCDGWIELDHMRVARLEPSLRLSVLDKLIELFDAVDEDAETVAQLEERPEHREREKKAP